MITNININSSGTVKMSNFREAQVNHGARVFTTSSITFDHLPQARFSFPVFAHLHCLFEKFILKSPCRIVFKLVLPSDSTDFFMALIALSTSPFGGL